LRHTLKALAEEVPPTYFDLLVGMERSILMGYVATFADPVSRLRLIPILRDEPVQLDWDALSPLETLQTFAGLVTQLGQSSKARYQALYILVDRVDETAAGPTAAVRLLRPLVSEGPLLEMAHVAFKFFLPREIGEQLQQAVSLRSDRLCIQTITWDQPALQKMIQQRLSYYSEARVERLEEFCTPGAKSNAMDRLIKACEGCPRTLLRLCRELIRHHVERTDDALIDLTDIREAIADFVQHLEVERLQPATATVAGVPPSRPATPPEKGLYIDDSGHVWVDAELLTPPLSELEFRLLKALFQQAPEIVAHEALIEAVWPSSAWTSDKNTHSMDEQNLRKLVDRLRDRLEPRASGQRSCFVKNVRGRGYWLKTEHDSVE